MGWFLAGLAIGVVLGVAGTILYRLLTEVGYKGGGPWPP